MSLANKEPRGRPGAPRNSEISGPYFFLVVSFFIAESECCMPAIPVSDTAGAIAEVSAAGVPARFEQPASARTAVISRIVFIVTPSGVGRRWITAVAVAGQRREGEGKSQPEFVKVREFAERRR